MGMCVRLWCPIQSFNYFTNHLSKPRYKMKTYNHNIFIYLGKTSHIKPSASSKPKVPVLSIVPYYIQPILLLTWSIPCLFPPAFSCPLYHCFYSSWCIVFFLLFPLIFINPFNYPEQGKEKFKTFEECHVIHIFNVSMCKNIKHNVTGNSCRRERDESLNFHILWPNNFCPTSSHFT